MIDINKKGKVFESQCVKILQQRTNSKWNRSAHSGSQETKTSDPGFQGDIYSELVCYQDIGIECKARKEVSFTSLFSRKSELHKWMKKLEARHTEWLLFIKPNRQGIYVIANSAKTMERIFKKHDWDIEWKMNLKYIMLKVC